MSAETHAGARDVPMSWDEYLALGEGVRGEYVDGKLHVPPQPTFRHQVACTRLTSLLAGAGHLAVADWAWKPGPHEWHPDVMVVGEDVDVSANRYTGRPRLIVEVLSSNATDDTIRKMHQYALHGLPHYWILGQYERTLWTYELTGSTFRQTAEITGRGTPPGWDVEVAVDEVLLR
ncbi:Uma2 family endonuclease [Kineococcus sp. G2]|uniref:Uma2 family endonuclease n=1 Tax=Kineococcus sp. G2 TaxID=3127484 RepID=UPI00301BCDEE